MMKKLALPLVLLAMTTIVVAGAAKHDLTPPEGAADTDASGFVKVKGHKKTGELHLFEVKIKKVDRDATYGLFLEDVADSGEFVKVGELVVKGKQKDPDDHKAGGAGKFKVNTRRKKDNTLVLGEGGAQILYLAELLGRAVEVRNGDDVVLAGEIPAPVEE